MNVSELQIVKEQVETWGYGLGDSKVASLLGYARLLAEYEAANVIGIRDVPTILRDHILDSLSCLLAEPVRGARTLADIGAGGGLPGIPLVIACPQLEVTLVEATGKKAHFLQQVVSRLSIDGAEIVNARVEEVGHIRGRRGFYDVTTARALAPLPVLLEYCLPLTRRGGHVVAMKSMPGRDELEAGEKAAGILGAELVEEIGVTFLPEIPAKQRRILVFSKRESTPPAYPRRAGIPKKRPLGAR